MIAVTKEFQLKAKATKGKLCGKTPPRTLMESDAFPGTEGRFDYLATPDSCEEDARSFVASLESTDRLEVDDPYDERGGH